MTITIKRGPVAADNFTVISNRLLRDARLSLKARGLACWLLSHRADFALTLARIAQLNECGEDQVRKAVIELEDCGYLAREQGHDATTGQFEKITYYISDLPAHDESPGQDRGAVSRERVTRERETGAHKKTTLKKTTLKKTTNQDFAADAAGDQLPLLPGLEPPTEEKAAEKEPTLNQRAVLLAQRHYERLGKMGHVAAWVKIIRKALEHGYQDPQVDIALQFIGDHNWSLTEERLANTLRGGPRPASQLPPPVNGQRKIYQQRPDGKRGMELQES